MDSSVDEVGAVAVVGVESADASHIVGRVDNVVLRNAPRRNVDRMDLLHLGPCPQLFHFHSFEQLTYVQKRSA